MNQVTGLTSTYSSDEFGICSALFELGGLVVMHDASGCNSTYTTHDEPRWYDMDSMIYVSAISEMEAIMGDDEKLIRDLVKTAEELHPKFIAVIGAPIPYMIGTDFEAIAAITERRTGIPTFGFPANGMGLYTKGISMALKALTERYCTGSMEKSPVPTLNILGMTPLDYSVNGSVDSIWEWAAALGFERGVCMSMGSTLEQISRAGSAHVNLVVSYGGLEAARILEQRYGTPYVVGTPFGTVFAEKLGRILQETAASGKRRHDADLVDITENIPGRESAGNTDCKGTESALFKDSDNEADVSCSRISERTESNGSRISEQAEAKESRMSEQTEAAYCMMPELAADAGIKPLLIVGESVYCGSLAAALELELGIPTKVLCPVDTEDGLLREKDLRTPEEDDLIREFKQSDRIAADLLFRALAPEQTAFYNLPHVAFSGRIFDEINRNMVNRPLGDIFPELAQ